MVYFCKYEFSDQNVWWVGHMGQPITDPNSDQGLVLTFDPDLDNSDIWTSPFQIALLICDITIYRPGKLRGTT